MATRALRRVHSTTARSVRGVCAAPRRAVPRCASAALSTGVPRQPGVRDGPWTRRDADLVREALEEGSESKQPSEGKARKRAARAAERGKETFLLGLSQTEVSAALSAVEPDLPAFRGKQLHAAMYGSARIKELEGVTTFSKALREQLGEAGLRVGRQPVHTSVEAKDGTQKYLLRLADSRLVETVAIPALKSERQRLTAAGGDG